MTDNPLGNIVFSKNVIEFVTVGVEYCSFLENVDNDIPASELTDKLTKLLPLLYLKTTLITDKEVEYEVFSEITVTEEDYNYILKKIYNIYKSSDSYLEVFMEDMKYSDTPISASISEDLSDIYQDLKNFVSVYEQGVEENMQEALFVCCENFKMYWGQKLVNVLRALHSLRYGDTLDSANEDDFYSENLDDL